MKKLKVMTIVGTRPEIIRLSRVIAKLDTFCDHVLVHTGQNYDHELSQIFFDELEMRKPDYFLSCTINSNTVSKTIGNIIIAVDEAIALEEPDAILVLGDTNSCLSVIPAKRRKIPIFHMEAGNRCFDQRVPEEINRRIVDHTADINLTYSDIARDYLLNEGLPADQIIKIGSPMNEVLNYYMPKIEASKILSTLKLKQNEYFLISAHREENIDSDRNILKLISALNNIAKTYNFPVIVSTHPRTNNRLEMMNVKLHANIMLSKPFGFFDYIYLQMHAKAVLSDSGTISEEASILNFPALNIREAHERPEGMEEGVVIMSGLDKHRIMQSLEVVAEQQRGDNRGLNIVADYDKPNVSDKVLRIILSYTDYVDRVVWKKYE